MKVLFIAAFWNRNNTVTNNTAQNNNTKEKKNISPIIGIKKKWPLLCKHQWWSVTKYNYFVTVLKYIFQVSVLYWSSFILSNFYFYFTTFQSIRSYFLLHYIS